MQCFICQHKDFNIKNPLYLTSSQFKDSKVGVMRSHDLVPVRILAAVVCRLSSVDLETPVRSALQ